MIEKKYKPTHPSPRVHCPQPWPRPTTTRSRRRSSGDGVRSARCSIVSGSRRLPAPSRAPHKLHAAACAGLCGGTQELAHSLCARGGVRIRAARQHGMHTAHSSAVAACSALSAPSSQPAYPPHPVAHPLETQAPMGFRCPMPLRTHLPPAAQHCRGGTRPVRAPDVNSRCEMQPSFCPTLTCLSHTLVSLATLLLNASMLLVVPSEMHVTSRALK